jgi:hypothetical protein
MLTGNRIFNIECPKDLVETVLCLDLDEFEDLQREPGSDSENKAPEIFTDQEFVLYGANQNIAKSLYQYGRNFAEIYKSVRQHVLACEHCSERYVQFLGGYVLREIKRREKEDWANIPSLFEEVGNLPKERRIKFFLNCLEKADEKYLKILNVKTVRKYKPLDEELVGMFDSSYGISLELAGFRRTGLDYCKLRGVN